MTPQMQQQVQTSRRRVLGGSAVAQVSLPLAGVGGAAFAATRTTQAVLEHHLGAFANGQDEIMKAISAAAPRDIRAGPRRIAA